MSDLDPGHAMPPVPKGWQMHSRDGYGIVLPFFTRKDGVAVKFSTSLAAWAVFSGTGEQLKEFGSSHTPGGMMAHVDSLEPLSVRPPVDGEEFDALFRGMLTQKLVVVRFRDGQMALELTPKGLAAWSILECVKAGA